MGANDGGTVNVTTGIDFAILPISGMHKLVGLWIRKMSESGSALRKSSVLVTGASGFIGRAVVRHLGALGCPVTAVCRGQPPTAPISGAVREVSAGDLSAPDSVLRDAMRGVNVVVHAAGYAHRAAPDRASLVAANVTAAARVAEIAASCGVGRLVLISSAAVHGISALGVITEIAPVASDDAYALSKFEGEMVARATLVGAKTNLVIVRPCAVVGPGCAGNIPRLARLIMRVPILPFGAIGNLRSFIAIDDLAELIGHAALSERSPEVVLAAHRTPISTPDLIRALAYGLERRVFLAPIPVSWLGAAAKYSGHSRQWQSFSGSFRADVGLARHAFGFDAQTPVLDALIATAKRLW